MRVEILLDSDKGIEVRRDGKLKFEFSGKVWEQLSPDRREHIVLAGAAAACLSTGRAMQD